MKSPLRLSLLLYLVLDARAFGVKRAVKEVVSEEEDSSVSDFAEAAKVTLPEKLPYLAGSIVLGSTDRLVHKLFNETDRSELKQEKGNYKRTLIYGVAESIDVGAKAYGITVVADILASIFPAIKQAMPFQVESLFEVAPHIGFMVWSVKSFSTIKNLLLNKLVYGTRLGKVEFMDRLIDLGLGVGAVYNVLGILKYEMGVSLRGFFAASGVSAIVISLAVKGMVEQMVGGLLLQAWDAVEVGESVKLADGTEGTVVRIGLVETEILGGDHVPIRVPNSQIVGKRVHMYSRVSKSKVKQTLRFKYSDLDKMPKVLADIKDEITSCCSEKMLGEPNVLLSNYENDHIQVTVSCSFDFSPSAKEYEQTKQSALFAIANAMKKNKVEFALPAIQYETNGKRPIYQ